MFNLYIIYFICKLQGEHIVSLENHEQIITMIYYKALDSTKLILYLLT